MATLDPALYPYFTCFYPHIDSVIKITSAEVGGHGGCDQRVLLVSRTLRHYYQ
jgi:hypothetical protein